MQKANVDTGNRAGRLLAAAVLTVGSVALTAVVALPTVSAETPLTVNPSTVAPGGSFAVTGDCGTGPWDSVQAEIDPPDGITIFPVASTIGVDTGMFAATFQLEGDPQNADYTPPGSYFVRIDCVDGDFLASPGSVFITVSGSVDPTPDPTVPTPDSTPDTTAGGSESTSPATAAAARAASATPRFTG